ncbi:MAG: tetratricopeptide repeat protein [Cyclobacteriaceae bacterium]
MIKRIAIRMIGQGVFCLVLMMSGLEAAALPSMLVPVDTTASNEAYRRALQKFSEGDLFDAQIDLRECIKQNPRNGKAYRLRAEIERRLGKNEDAERSFSSAIYIDANDSYAFAGRADIRRGLEKYADALADYNRVVSLGKPDAGIWFGRGVCRVQLKDYAGAIPDLLETEKQSPRAFLIYMHRGNAYYQLGYYDQALQDFAKYFRFKGDKGSDVYYYRGMVYNELREPAKALADFKDFLATHKSDPRAYAGMGESYAISGDTVMMRDSFEKALALKSQAGETLVRWAGAACRTGAFSLSVRKLKEASERGARTELLQLQWAKTYLALGDTAAARNAFIESRRTDAGLQALYTARIHAFMHNRNEQQQVAEDFACLIAMTKDTLRLARLHAARAYFSSLHGQATKEDLAIASALAPGDGCVQLYLLLASTPSSALSPDGFDKIIAADPSFGWTYGVRASVYAASGDRKSACRDFTKASESGANVSREWIAWSCAAQDKMPGAFRLGLEWPLHSLRPGRAGK